MPGLSPPSAPPLPIRCSSWPASLTSSSMTALFACHRCCAASVPCWVSPSTRGISAVAHKRVYLAPAYPFGWIDDPPGVNRLIGLHWLSGLFYPDANQDDLRAAVCEFYDQFYRIKLTNAQVEAMVRPAGAPPL